MRERPVSQVPRWVLALLGGALGLQLWVGATRPDPHAAAEDLGWPPSVHMLRLASFGEPVPLAKLLMLYLQAFDYQAGTRVPYRDLDYDRLEAWLARIVALDPTVLDIADLPPGWQAVRNNAKAPWTRRIHSS